MFEQSQGRDAHAAACVHKSPAVLAIQEHLHVPVLNGYAFNFL
jgi:Asp/Glu/hydantoin racemase